MSPSTTKTPKPVSRRTSPLVWVGVAFGVWVFAQVAVLTIPKYPRRKTAMEMRAEGRSRAWQQQLEQQGAVSPTEAPAARDWLLIGGVSAGGGLVVLGLALMALRRPGRQDEVSGKGSRPGDAAPTVARAPPGGHA